MFVLFNLVFLVNLVISCAVDFINFFFRSNRNMLDDQLSFAFKTEATQANYNCMTCQVTFYGLEEIKSHYHQNSCRYFCGSCARQFDTKGAMFVHIIEHDVKNDCKPEYEDFYWKFEDLDELDLHESESDRSQVEETTEILLEHNYHRTEENILYFRNNAAERHKYELTGYNKCKDVPTECHQIKVQSTLKKVRNETGTTHSLLNNSTKTHQCELCQKSFFSRCEKCDKSFPTLHKHLLTHSEEKPFKCTECDMCFSEPSGLQIHLQTTHTDEEPYKCTICDKYFLQKNAFKVHMLVHTRKEPVTCNECGKCFKKSTTLNVHILRTHSRDKPYKCSKCGNTFNTRKGLNIHLYNHTKTKLTKPLQTKHR